MRMKSVPKREWNDRFGVGSDASASTIKQELPPPPFPLKGTRGEVLKALNSLLAPKKKGKPAYNKPQRSKPPEKAERVGNEAHPTQTGGRSAELQDVRASNQRMSSLQIDVTDSVQINNDEKQLTKEVSEVADLINSGINVKSPSVAYPLCRLELLGRGSSSSVYKSVILSSLKLCAEKVVAVADSSKRSQLCRELKSLKKMLADKDGKMKCENIIGLLDLIPNPRDGTLSICLEYMDGGSLQDLVKQGKRQSEVVMRGIAKQMLLGLSFLHSLRLIHRDVKPSNALISSSGLVKLADFGLARVLEQDMSMAESFCGTFDYMAPERMMGGAYSFHADVWSLGLTIHTVAMGAYPYANANGGFWAILNAVQEQTVSLPKGEFSENFVNFVAACCARDPKQRQSAQHLLNHPFIVDEPELSVAVVSTKGAHTGASASSIASAASLKGSAKSQLQRTGTHKQSAVNRGNGNVGSISGMKRLNMNSAFTQQGQQQQQQQRSKPVVKPTGGPPSSQIRAPVRTHRDKDKGRGRGSSQEKITASTPVTQAEAQAQAQEGKKANQRRDRSQSVTSRKSNKGNAVQSRGVHRNDKNKSASVESDTDIDNNSVVSQSSLGSQRSSRLNRKTAVEKRGRQPYRSDHDSFISGRVGAAGNRKSSLSIDTRHSSRSRSRTVSLTRVKHSSMPSNRQTKGKHTANNDNDNDNGSVYSRTSMSNSSMERSSVGKRRHRKSKGLKTRRDAESGSESDISRGRSTHRSVQQQQQQQLSIRPSRDGINIKQDLVSLRKRIQEKTRQQITERAQSKQRHLQARGTSFKSSSSSRSISRSRSRSRSVSVTRGNRKDKHGNKGNVTVSLAMSTAGGSSGGAVTGTGKPTGSVIEANSTKLTAAEAEHIAEAWKRYATLVSIANTKTAGTGTSGGPNSSGRQGQVDDDQFLSPKTNNTSAILHTASVARIDALARQLCGNLSSDRLEAEAFVLRRAFLSAVSEMKDAVSQVVMLEEEHGEEDDAVVYQSQVHNNTRSSNHEEEEVDNDDNDDDLRAVCTELRATESELRSSMVIREPTHGHGQGKGHSHGLRASQQYLSTFFVTQEEDEQDQEQGGSVGKGSVVEDYGEYASDFEVDDGEGGAQPAIGEVIPGVASGVTATVGSGGGGSDDVDRSPILDAIVRRSCQSPHTGGAVDATTTTVVSKKGKGSSGDICGSGSGGGGVHAEGSYRFDDNNTNGGSDSVGGDIDDRSVFSENFEDNEGIVRNIEDEVPDDEEEKEESGGVNVPECEYDEYDDNRRAEQKEEEENNEYLEEVEEVKEEEKGYSGAEYNDNYPHQVRSQRGLEGRISAVGFQHNISEEKHSEHSYNNNYNNNSLRSSKNNNNATGREEEDVDVDVVEDDSDFPAYGSRPNSSNSNSSRNNKYSRGINGRSEKGGDEKHSDSRPQTVSSVHSHPSRSHSRPSSSSSIHSDISGGGSDRPHTGRRGSGGGGGTGSGARSDHHQGASPLTDSVAGIVVPTDKSPSFQPITITTLRASQSSPATRLTTTSVEIQNNIESRSNEDEDDYGSDFED